MSDRGTTERGEIASLRAALAAAERRADRAQENALANEQAIGKLEERRDALQARLEEAQAAMRERGADLAVEDEQKRMWHQDFSSMSRAAKKALEREREALTQRDALQARVSRLEKAAREALGLWDKWEAANKPVLDFRLARLRDLLGGDSDGS